MKRSFFIALLCVLLSKTLIGQNILKIELIYGREGTLLPVSASCTPESFSFNFAEDINYLTTYDDIFIYNFQFYYNELPSITSRDSIKYIDPRIMTILTYKDSIANDTIYWGEFHGIYQNGRLMEDNERLLNLIKKKIGWKNNYSDEYAIFPE